VKRLKDLRREVAEALEDLREYERIAGFFKIARRALANNSFDGVLTTIGLLMGNYVSGVRNPLIVIRTGVSTSIAIGISGLWGAYLAESAERGRELAELERVSLTDLAETKIARAGRVAVIIVSITDGLAPFISSIIVLIPMFLVTWVGDVVIGYLLSMILALVTLFGLGMYLGNISGRSMVGYGFRTVIAGIVSIAFAFLLGGEQ
jgi:predicted membrane protein (TIGR00267 family)